jgi:acyl carrier protein
MIELEERFGVELPAEETSTLPDVGALYKLILQRKSGSDGT